MSLKIYLIICNPCIHVYVSIYFARFYNNFSDCPRSLIYIPVFLAMSNQELIDAGVKTMNETDQAIERSKQVNELCKLCS